MAETGACMYLSYVSRGKAEARRRARRCPRPAAWGNDRTMVSPSSSTSCAHMSDTELRALTALGFDELRQATDGIGSIQRAVSSRVFRAVGPGAALVRPVHDAVTRGVYTGLGIGTRAVGLAAQAVVG